ncbi:MAG: ribonuclease P protein component [Phycisphaerales bacterium]
MPLRFTKAMQLTHDREYQRVYAARSSVTRGPLRVSGIANALSTTRLGLSVPRKVGTNVKRNRVKRLIREAFRLNYKSIPPGLDLVVGVYPHDEKLVEEYAAILIAAAENLSRRAKGQLPQMNADERG